MPGLEIKAPMLSEPGDSYKAFALVLKTNRTVVTKASPFRHANTKGCALDFGVTIHRNPEEKICKPLSFHLH